MKTLASRGLSIACTIGILAIAHAQSTETSMNNFRSTSEIADALKWRQLTGSEIAATLSGKSIVPDLSSQSPKPPFGEFFYSDHTWLGTLQEFSLKMVRGHWEIRDNKICVRPIDELEECRSVWRDIKTHQISIKPLDLWRKDSAPLAVNISNIN